jgi:hypothetical protein
LHLELAVVMVDRDELVSGKSVSKSERTVTVERKYLDTKGQVIIWNLDREERKKESYHNESYYYCKVC